MDHPNRSIKGLYGAWALASCLVVATAHLVSAQVKEENFPENEFRHEGGTIVCFSRSEPSSGYLPCLRIGELAVGLPLKEMEKRIEKIGGCISGEHPDWKDLVTRLYLLPVPKGEVEAPYLVVAYGNGKAESIQLTGKQTEHSLAFSSVRLGDSPIRVVGLIGPAFSTEHDPETGETRWDYSPFPFRIGFKDGKVRSILVQKGG